MKTLTWVLLFCLLPIACSNEQPNDDFDQTPPLLSAAESGDLPAIRQILNNKTQVDIRDACLWTPLMKAALNGHLEAARQLIEAGADIDLTDKGGYSALMLAASNNHAELVELLLKAGADPNLREQTEGFTALIWASKLGHVETVNRLLTAGADRSLRDLEGKSALDWAIARNDTALVALLTPANQSSPLNAQDPASQQH